MLLSSINRSFLVSIKDAFLNTSKNITEAALSLLTSQHLPQSVPHDSPVRELVSSIELITKLQKINYKVIDVCVTQNGSYYVHLGGKNDWERMVNISGLDHFISEENNYLLARQARFEQLLIASKFRRSRTNRINPLTPIRHRPLITSISPRL